MSQPPTRSSRHLCATDACRRPESNRPTPTVHGAGRLRSSVGGFGKYRTALQLGFDTAITGMLETYIRETLAARTCWSRSPMPITAMLFTATRWHSEGRVS
jgi:hypothetical protein